MRTDELLLTRHTSTKSMADPLRALAMLLVAFNHPPPSALEARNPFGRGAVSRPLLQMSAKSRGFGGGAAAVVGTPAQKKKKKKKTKLDLRASALEAQSMDESIGSLGTAQHTEADNSLVFAISNNHSEWCGSSVSEHFSYASLEDVFNVAFADAFHTSFAFRQDLAEFGFSGAVHALFATEGFATSSWAFMNDANILEWQMDGSLQILRDKGRSMFEDMLKKHLGRDAPSAEQFILAFKKLCGEGCRGMFTPLGSQPPPNAVEWHQDWSPPDENSFTVSLGFPPADNYTGVGVLTELVRLSHRFGMERFRQSKFPLTDVYQNYTAEDCAEADRKGLEELGITETYRIQPVFKRGQEILIYRDSDHLHRGPKQDVLLRADCWRFQ